MIKQTPISKRNFKKFNTGTKIFFVMFILLNMTFKEINTFEVVEKTETLKVTSKKKSPNDAKPKTKSFEVTKKEVKITPPVPLDNVDEKEDLPYQLADQTNVLTAKEVRSESVNALKICKDIKDKKEYADCVVDSFSVEFFYTAFIHFKKKYKKNYKSAMEEINKFQIFMDNYQMILK